MMVTGWQICYGSALLDRDDKELEERADARRPGGGLNTRYVGRRAMHPVWRRRPHLSACPKLRLDNQMGYGAVPPDSVHLLPIEIATSPLIHLSFSTLVICCLLENSRGTTHFKVSPCPSWM
eukprot:sb/3475990/